MKPMHRSLSGLLIAIVTLPVFMSLLACLPVPVGDPEKSRIDPGLSGLWFMPGEAAIVFIEPFDERTWLILMMEAEFDDEICPEAETEGEDGGGYDALINRLQEANEGCFSLGEIDEIYKAWRTKLGSHWFMTWEPVFGEGEGFEFETDFWFVFRIDDSNKNEVALSMVNADYDGFDDPAIAEKLDELEEQGLPYDPRALKRARVVVEKVIRRNADDDALYEDNELVLIRILPEHYDLFE